jgi:hypothetical protein
MTPPSIHTNQWWFQVSNVTLDEILYLILFNKRVQDSSVGIATEYGLKVRDRIPVGTRFSACQDRPWDPPSLL